MRTAYLVRKNTWMSDAERRVARKIAREGEKRLGQRPQGIDGASAVVFYAAGCAVAVLGRVTERYMDLLAAGEDLKVMQEVVAQAQLGAFQAARAMEVLIAGRVASGAMGEDWYRAAGTVGEELTSEGTEAAEEEEEGKGEEGSEKELQSAAFTKGDVTKRNLVTREEMSQPSAASVEEIYMGLPRRERRHIERQARREAKKHEKRGQQRAA